MLYRKLGKWGIKVSEVGLGGWLTQGRTISQETTDAIVRKAFDLGINFFDTADVYHGGRSERALAEVLHGLRREDLVIATKCFFPMSESPNARGLGRKHIVESIHKSLNRLQTDYIDLYQFHRFDPDTPLEETVRAIDDAIRQGKVLYWGVSEWPYEKIAEVCDLCKSMNACPPVSNQPNYSLLQRRIEANVLPTCEQRGMGLVGFSPMAQGALTGKYQPGQAPPKGSRGADDESNMFMSNVLDPEVLTQVQTAKAYVEGKGYTLTQVALAWCLRQSTVSSVIVGATKVDHIVETASASGLGVSEEILNEVARLIVPLPA